MSSIRIGQRGRSGSPDPSEQSIVEQVDTVLADISLHARYLYYIAESLAAESDGWEEAVTKLLPLIGISNSDRRASTMHATLIFDFAAKYGLSENVKKFIYEGAKKLESSPDKPYLEAERTGLLAQFAPSGEQADTFLIEQIRSDNKETQRVGTHELSRSINRMLSGIGARFGEERRDRPSKEVANFLAPYVEPLLEILGNKIMSIPKGCYVECLGFELEHNVVFIFRMLYAYDPALAISSISSPFAEEFSVFSSASGISFRFQGDPLAAYKEALADNQGYFTPVGLGAVNLLSNLILTEEDDQGEYLRALAEHLPQTGPAGEFSMNYLVSNALLSFGSEAVVPILLSAAENPDFLASNYILNVLGHFKEDISKDIIDCLEQSDDPRLIYLGISSLIDLDDIGEIDRAVAIAKKGKKLGEERQDLALEGISEELLQRLG